MNEHSPFAILNRNRRYSSPSVDLQSLLDSFPFPCLVVDPKNLTVLYCNSPADALIGWSNSDICGRDLATLFTDWVDPATPLNKASTTLEVHISRPDQSIQKIRIHSQPLPEKKPYVLVVLETLIDREAAEAEQPPTNESFLLTLQSMLDSTGETELPLVLESVASAGLELIACDALAIYLAANEAPELILVANAGETGGLPGTLPAKDLAHLSEPSLWDKGKRSQTTLHRQARHHGFHTVATAPIGTATAAIGLVAAASSNPISSEDFLLALQVISAVISTRIETDSLKIQIELNNHEYLRTRSYDQAADSAVGEGLILVSRDLRIIKINPAAENIFGYQSSEILNTSVENILIGSDKLLPRLVDPQMENLPIHLEGIYLFRRFGDSFLANAEIHQLWFDGELDRLLIVIKDLSETEQIREQAQQLEQRALLGEVTAIFAHEVRNPINNISTGLELMSVNLPPDDAQQVLIQRMQQDCDRLTELMKSVLAFSKPVEFNLELIHLPNLVQKLLDRLEPRLVKAGIKHHLQVEKNIPAVLADYRALEQALNNLIANAAQAMSENGGQLTIKIKTMKPQKAPEVREDRPSVEISIADTGPGIPKELQDRVFQPFFTTNRNGTGLGLVITRRIITAHKGTIHLTSFPGGTVFTIRLPVAESA